MIRELVKYRELLWAFICKNITIRYKQTMMGLLWALFMPSLVVVSGVIVKKAMSMLSGTPLELTDIASVSVKSLPWAFFVGALKFSVTSLVGNMNMVQKIYFPREIFPVSFVISQFFDFLVASAVLAVFLAFAKIGLSVYLLWLPVLVLLLLLLTAGLAIILSCGALFFRDVKYILDVVLTFGIFFTPVFYSAKMFKSWEPLLLLNPMGALLEALNNVVILHRAPDPLWL